MHDVRGTSALHRPEWNGETPQQAKYADEIDFDSLPDPDVYLQKRYIYESYKAYMKFRNKKTKWNIEGYHEMW